MISKQVKVMFLHHCLIKDVSVKVKIDDSLVLVGFFRSINFVYDLPNSSALTGYLG